MKKLKEEKAITLIALVITIIVLLILASISVATLTGNNGILNKANKAKEETEIKGYYEKIELIRNELRLQKENFVPPTIAEMKSEFEKNQKDWVVSTEIKQIDAVETLELKTKEGYIFHITETRTEYKGKGKIVDTSALKREDALKLEIIGEASNGKKLVEITDLSGEDYYQIEYQIDSTTGTWQIIESGGQVEVGASSTIYARLTYETNKGIIISLSIEATEPTIVARNIDTSEIVRKTQIPFADLFEITWGSDGTGTVEYNVLGNLNFNNMNYNSKDITSLSDLEIGNYIIICKISSPSNKQITATKQNVNVTKLANTTVTNDSNNNVNAYAIYSQYDLAYFRDLVNSGSNNINAKQMENIDLNTGKWTSDENWITTFEADAIQWNSIGTSTFDINTSQFVKDNPFNGIYDGNSKEISGLYINCDTAYGSGLFGYCENAILKNIVLRNSSIFNFYCAAGIVGNAYDCQVMNCESYANVKSTFVVGGNVGIGVQVTIENCVNYGKIEESRKTEESAFGGIIGYAESAEVLHCKNYGIIIIEHSDGRNQYFAVSGIVGKGAYEITINNCSNEGSISATGSFSVSGILGISVLEKNRIAISNCYNTGSISTNSNNNSQGYAGGIVGIGNGVAINNCYNTGNIKGDWAAGIAEWLRYRKLYK